MSKGLSNKLAGQVGEFLVCAELGRRGLIATPFSGNVPEYDLIVADESLKTLPVQVKTSRSHS
jgi:Holliday junction resolvase-like predicted endonuclease